MISQLLFRLHRVSRKLWVRSAIISALALVSAAVSPLLTPFMPSDLLAKIDEEIVRSLLDILANSMLAVTTFSLTIMVTTHLTASQQVTPRAHRILREDVRTQTVLATFIGAFVFAITGIVMLQTDIAGPPALPVLYITTLGVLGLVIVAILRWIGHLASLGSVEETTRKVETHAREAMSRRMANPFLGGQPLRPADIAEDADVVAAKTSGYVQHIDTARLDSCLGTDEARLWVRAKPGDWVMAGETLALVSGVSFDEEIERDVRNAFTLGDTRTFEQDAVFGASVLTEIAERALSPSTNDPRTAIDIITRHLTILEDWDDERARSDPASTRVFVPPMDMGLWVDTAFHPIARDGAAFVEVGLHVQIALARLARHRSPAIAEAARVTARRALREAEAGLKHDADIARVRAAAPEGVSV